MSDNPNFIANMSSDEVYYGQDMTLCLTDVVADKADVDHSHSGYASTEHTHSGYASQSDLDLLEDVVDTKADATHTHSGYALSSHSHSDYATVIALDTLGEEVDGKASVDHSHAEYATLSHIHSDYAAVNHDHDEDYALISHAHSDYATIVALNEVSATVSEKANASHSHDDLYYTETEVDTKLAGKADVSHTHTGIYDASGAAANALTSANAYTDSKIDALVGDGASTTLDTIGEISSAIEDNQDAIDLLNAAIGNKANASDLTSHISNKSNPHGVTLAQLGVTATASELNYVDGVTSNIQTQLNAKAASSHGTHVTYSTTAPKANGTAAVGTATTVSRSDHIHPLQTTVSGNAGTATKLSTARTISLTGDVSGSASFDGSANVSITTTVADDSHNHVIANIDGLQTALDVKSDNDHRHYPISITVTGQDLNDYTDAGFYTFAQAYTPTNAPSGNVNGWLLVIPWNQNNSTIKQLWFRHGTIGSNDFETFVRTKIGNNSWGSWSKYYTTSNPPTAAEVGASPAFTNSEGGVEYSYGSNSGKNVLTEISNMSQGLHTIYAISGTTGNPKSNESFRYLIHKTSATIGWILAWDAQGSLFTNYQSAANTFKGWKCVYDAAPSALWAGAYYMSSSNSTPQTVKPSKKLSECRTGWVLIWSDYDADTGAKNNTDIHHDYVFKRNVAGANWSGQCMLCDIPRYVGSNAQDVDTERRIIKPIYIHDDRIEGSYQNSYDERNDVVLRAVYEF